MTAYDLALCDHSRHGEFIDIWQNAKKVVFCGSLSLKADLSVGDGEMRVLTLFSRNPAHFIVLNPASDSTVRFGLLA